MEYDSGSSCEERLKDLQDSEAIERIDSIANNNRAERESNVQQSSSSQRWYNLEETPKSRACVLPVVTKRNLSTQVMEYYQKYSQNSSLGRYFSLAEPVSIVKQATSRRGYPTGLDSSVTPAESYVILTDEERNRQDSSIPRERRRWARPPLVGQTSSSDVAVTSAYAGATIVSRTPSPMSKRPLNETIQEERDESSRETLNDQRDNETKPSISPTSSVASHKPLEWDSGADVGYYNALLPRNNRDRDKKLCTIERMALARGCSVAMRLDPEGTNESTNTSSRINKRPIMKPDANSTPLIGRISGESESEIEITPIVKNHSSSGATTFQVEKSTKVSKNVAESSGEKKVDDSRTNRGASPIKTKYPTEGSRSREMRNAMQLSPLKKSSSMNLLALPMSILSPKRSQSELNLRGREKKALPLIFDSMSSIATVVNKPMTCDKFIQTSLDDCSRESVGIQVELTQQYNERVNVEIEENPKDKKSEEKRENDEKEEEKPPLPKRASSLGPKSLHSILKNSTNTYNIRDRDISISTSRNRQITENHDNSREKVYPPDNFDRVDGTARTRYKTRDDASKSSCCNSSSEQSRNNEASSSANDEIIIEETTEENATGRASNSFEYFPGHVYQNVRKPGSTSEISTCDTGRESRCSTMPNTSSSIDEKLWGDSDSLVRDLERSVNILKSLVDANKCDQQVKKRLIHHVIKRLVTAKYTDDRIERDLEANVPWNPADSRNKVYRNDIIQVLAGKKQQNTTDSSIDDWRPRKRGNNTRGNSQSPKKSLSKETRVMKKIIDIAASSRDSTLNSDKFPFDRHNDGTVMDGRKARMGLRSEDHRSDTNTDLEKSQSSDCFMPQSKNQHQINSTNVYYSMEKNSNENLRETDENFARDTTTSLMTTTTSTVTTATTSTSVTSTSSTSHENPMSDRIVIVKERRRNESNETDWRLPTTMSERRFELGRCSNSESGDTRLINYAEMEKRNQLVWITNEISHLCNLKNLLEEHNKVGTRSRGGGNSMRKRLDELPIDEWIVRAHTERNSSSRTDRARGTTGSDAAIEHNPRLVSLDKCLENQWSSHGNLASGRSHLRATKKLDDERIERVGHTRKRNSCTQTASHGEPSGHSKTGVEIVSATLLPIFAPTTSARTDRSMCHSMRDASTQTLALSPEKISNVVSTSEQVSTDPSTRFGHSSNCPTRVKSPSNVDEKKCPKSQRHSCYCQRYAAHSRHRACIIHSPQRSTNRQHSKNCPRNTIHKTDARPIITQPIVTQIPATSAKSMESRKETKNQLNATCKSKYAIRELPDKRKARCQRCDEEKNEIKADVATETLKTMGKSSKNNDSMENCNCPRDCDCDDAVSPGNEGVNRETDEEIASPCCETVSEVEDETGRRENSSSFPRCTCNVEKHPCGNRETGGADVGSENLRKNVTATEINGVAKICKSCRTCGTIWPVKDGKNANRRCKCSQDYLKPVAYELHFDETTRERPKNVGGGRKITKIDKIVTKGLSTSAKTQTKATQSVPIVENTEVNCARDEDEDLDDEKDEDEDVNEDGRPGTLKGFLATNKPEFLDNVETRRRYMSELSQLRQLKREKRKQFLAMTGASDFSKPQRNAKGSTANNQRKLSEYEMKLRLRMRYLRLNEVRNKRRQREKEEDARRNHLMAKLFGRKLQQKVLKGQVDLSQSVSVISNL